MAYEDFTTFTEVDEGGTITVDSATKVSTANFDSSDETGYLYIDKGAGHFGGDFTHLLEIEIGAGTHNVYMHLWGLSNAVEDFRATYVGNGDCVSLLFGDDQEFLGCYVSENGVYASDSWAAPGPQISTTYYVTVDRDDDGGANNTGQYTMEFRTGSHTGALQDTLTVDCSAGEQNDFRYLYAVSSHDGSKNRGPMTSSFTQNLDLQEAAAAGAPTGALYGPLVGPLGGPI